MEIKLKKITILKKPAQLSDNIDVFCKNFRAGRYDIITNDPGVHGPAGDIWDCLCVDETYKAILNDPAAKFMNFAINMPIADDSGLVMPIGVYGNSDAHQTRFPLILNGFWLMFLTVGKAELAYIAGISDSHGLDKCYDNLLQMRQAFVKNIFSYYIKLNGKNHSTMAWNKRGEASMTRTIAEAIGFSRKEIEGHELYASSNLLAEQWDYVYSCVCRWIEVVDHQKQGNPGMDASPELQKFVRFLIGYGVEEDMVV